MQLNARIKHKRDTAANWSKNNPIPLDGEIIVVETTDGYTRLKVGDGVSNYGSLPFIDEDILEQISTNKSNITALTNSKVSGPGSAVSGRVPIFDGTTGKLIKDSGYTLGKSVPPDAEFTDTTYVTGTDTVAGITKLFTGTGTATDGAMTQAAVNTALALKANLASPTFTGAPKAPTAAAGTNTTQLATTAFVTTAVANKTSVSGNAGTATKLQTPRTITLGGDLSGSASFDGSEDITIEAEVGNDSHTHTIDYVIGLQTELDSKLDKTANAVSASKLAEARNISLTGDVSGSGKFDGSGDLSISVDVTDVDGGSY